LRKRPRDIALNRRAGSTPRDVSSKREIGGRARQPVQRVFGPGSAGQSAELTSGSASIALQVSFDVFYVSWLASVQTELRQLTAETYTYFNWLHSCLRILEF
jgi:hypothetical protein